MHDFICKCPILCNQKCQLLYLDHGVRGVMYCPHLVIHISTSVQDTSAFGNDEETVLLNSKNCQIRGNGYQISQ